MKKFFFRLEVLLPIIYTLLYIPLSKTSTGGFFSFSGDFVISVIGGIPFVYLYVALTKLILLITKINIDIFPSGIDFDNNRFIFAFLGYILIGFLLRKIFEGYAHLMEKLAMKYNKSQKKKPAK